MMVLRACATAAGNHPSGPSSSNHPTTPFPTAWKNPWPVEDGNTVPQSPSTPAVLPPFSHPSTPPVRRWRSSHKLVHTQAELSRPSLRAPSSRTRPTSSASCSSVVSVSRSRCQPVTADAVALSIPLATIVPPALPRGRCGAAQGRGHWKGQLPGYAEKPVQGWTHVLVSDLNMATTSRLDNRRVEVIAHGLPLHNGAQLAVDTSSGQPCPPGRSTGSLTSQRTHVPRARAGQSLPPGGHVYGSWREVERRAATFLRLLAKARSRAVLQALRSAATQAFLAVVRDILSSDRTVLNCGTSSTLWDRIPKPD